LEDVFRLSRRGKRCQSRAVGTSCNETGETHFGAGRTRGGGGDIGDRDGLRGATIKALGQALIPGSRPEHNSRNMQVTLANLKRAAESQQA
jgi:hypothetical protein